MRMKSIYSAVIAILFAVACQDVNGQDKKSNQKDVPEAVRTSFQAKYSGENDPDWHKDSNGYWESHFRIDGERHRADFRADGTWVETEVSMDKDELPDAVREIIKNFYGDEEITEVEKVSSAIEGKFYDVEFKKKGKNKDVMFRASGEIMN